MQQALRARSAAAAVDAQRSQIDLAAQFIWPGVTMDRELLSRSFDSTARRAAPDQQSGLVRQPVNGPNARILAVGYEGEGDGARATRGEILLSVSAPSSYWYGARWRGWIPQAKVKKQWWDFPVTIDPGNPREVEIRWDEVAGIEAVTSVLHSMNDRLEAQLAAGSALGPAPGIEAYRGLLSAIADPVQRAQVEQQLAQGLSAMPGAVPPPAPVPVSPRLDPVRRAEADRRAARVGGTERCGVRRREDARTGNDVRETNGAVQG